jgi:hypothetical protein
LADELRKQFSSPVQVISGMLYCLCRSIIYVKSRVVCRWAAWLGFRNRIDENRNLYYGLWAAACPAVLESGLSVSLVTLEAKWMAPSFLLKGPRFIFCLQSCAVIEILIFHTALRHNYGIVYETDRNCI